MQGASVGGGNILVTQVNGLPVELDGAHAALVVLHLDAPGTIAAVTEEMSRAGAISAISAGARRQRAAPPS